jgi:hypothetical protein
MTHTSPTTVFPPPPFVEDKARLSEATGKREFGGFKNLPSTICRPTGNAFFVENDSMALKCVRRKMARKRKRRVKLLQFLSMGFGLHQLYRCF